MVVPGIAFALVGALLPAGEIFAQNAAQCVMQCGPSCYSKPAQYVDSCHNACVYQCLHPGSGGGARRPYGSVYVSRAGSFGWANRFDAMDEAARHCREQKGGACARLLIFENKCAAIVQARRGDDVLGVAGSAEPVQADADAKGAAECRSLDPGGECVVVKRFRGD